MMKWETLCCAIALFVCFVSRPLPFVKGLRNVQFQSSSLLASASASSIRRFKRIKTIAVRTHDDKPYDETQKDPSTPRWQRVGGEPIATISSPWITIVAERYRVDYPNHATKADDRKSYELLDYWRIQRPSSVLVIVLHQDRYILPAPQFRPGIQQYTLDFVGGRCRSRDDESQSSSSSSSSSSSFIIKTATRLLAKELLTGLTEEQIQSCVQFTPLNNNNNNNGWPVDSSVSNQKLFAVVAQIDNDQVDAVHTWKAQGVVSYPSEQVDRLLKDLVCLQCRSALLEWLYQSNTITKNKA